MALFERPTHAHFAALSRQGFAARLRSETANIFLAQKGQSVVLTNDRKRASIFFFCGGDGPLTAILLRPPEKGEPQFLSVGDNVSATDSPTLLKLSLSDSNRQLFSVSRVAPTEYLSVRNVPIDSLVRTKPKLTKWELFHLEVLPDTIGRGFVSGSFTGTEFMKPSQAISHALLELGVRFRLRSVHDRVLRVSNGVIRQDGPRSLLASTYDDEILVTAFRMSDNSPDAKSANYAVKEASTGRFIKLHASSVKLVKDENTLCVRASPNDWGKLSVGNKAKGGFEWLMAGPKGRLEFRKNPGSWETFTMEFVRQTYDAAFRELPVPGIYKVAESVTRDRLRQQVEAKVAEAKKTGVQRSKKVSDKTKFDHSRALAGLSDPAPKTAAKTKQDGAKKEIAGQSQGETKSKPGAGAKGVRAGASASSLPRNKANKKAAKKRRKRQKQQSASRQAPLVKVPQNKGQNTPSSSKAENEKTSPETESRAEEAATSKAASSTPSRDTEGSRGPPCAACGRSLIGAYTTALGKSFHPECFCCGRCRRSMGAGAGQFRERGGIPYCTSCYATHLASRCARCSQPIMDTVVTAMEKTWHKDCLTCTICRLPLTQTFWLYADKPNEPRCSRCVTGDENYSRGGNSRRMVNLPMFGRSNNSPSFPMNGPSGSAGNSGTVSRARLIAPILPPTTKR